MGVSFRYWVLKDYGRGLVKPHDSYFVHFINILQDICSKVCYVDENHHFPYIISHKSCEKIHVFYDFLSEKLIFALFFHVYFQYIQICDEALTL